MNKEDTFSLVERDIMYNENHMTEEKERNTSEPTFSYTPNVD